MDPIENDKKNDIDHWLDEALHQYGKIEPRVGLEGRVLTGLQFERTRATAPSRWWWAAGIAAAFVAITVAVWIWQSGHQARRANTAGITTPRQELATTRPESHPARRVVTHEPVRQPMVNVTVAATPKREQFPSPRPLSEQEKLLISYVARDPEKAALVAQARDEALARDRQEEATWAAKSDTE